MRKDFTARPYQDLIIDHIINTPRCAVWAGMGTGKTVATLTAIDILQMVEDGPVLVVAPLRVANDTWPNEVLKWNHLREMNVSVITGPEKERIAAVKAPAQVYVTNYEQLVWLVTYWGDKWPYATVVLDESTKVKNFRLRQGGVRAQQPHQVLLHATPLALHIHCMHQQRGIHLHADGETDVFVCL